jgi:hypothetical protein
MFNMPECNQPVGDATSSFNFHKIFKFLQKMDKQKQSIVNCSAAYRAANAQRAKEAYQHTKQGPSGSVEEIVRSIIDKDTEDKKEETVPDDVNPEVNEIIKRIGALTLTIDQFSTFTQHPAVEKWFRNPANVTYAMGKVLASEPPSNHRNDGSYVSSNPKTVNFTGGTRVINGREYDNRCLMCSGTDGHRVRDCVEWQELRANGWAFSTQVEEGGRKVWEYHFGHFNQDLGIIPGKAPFTFIVNWIKAKCRDFYNVTDAEFSQRAKDACPDKFGKMVPAQSILQRGQSTNVLMSSATATPQMDLEADFLNFTQNMAVEDRSPEAYHLDATDREYLILNTLPSVNAATRSQKEPVTKPLAPPVRKGRVEKPAEASKKPSNAGRFLNARDFDTHPSLRRSNDSRDPTINLDMSDAQEAPRGSVSPAPSTLGWDVRPEDINTPEPVVSVPKTHVKKRSPQPSNINKIQELLSSEPSKSIAQALQQEVRGLNLADLMAFPYVRESLKECIQECKKRGKEKVAAPVSYQTNVVISTPLNNLNGYKGASDQEHLLRTENAQTNALQANSLTRHQVSGTRDT